MSGVYGLEYGVPALSDGVLSLTSPAGGGSVDLRPPPGAAIVSPTSLTGSSGDQLCVARTNDLTCEVAFLGLFSGGAHCCFSVQVFLPPTGGATPVSAPPGETGIDLGNPGATLRVEADTVVLVSADNAFAYEFASFAASGMPILVDTFSHNQFFDARPDYPILVRADAAMWWSVFQRASSGPEPNGLGALAAWAADECELRTPNQPWATIDQLLTAGALDGPEGWPTGPAYVSALRTFLAAHDYCR